jgi:hypothetical protein
MLNQQREAWTKMLDDDRPVIRETASKQLAKIEREREQLHHTFKCD